MTWHWKKNRTMQSLHDENNNRLGVYIPMPNNKSYPLEVRQNVGQTAALIEAAPELFKELDSLVAALEAGDAIHIEPGSVKAARMAEAIQKAKA